MELQEIKGSVAVLISGGVDSAVVVHRLCEAGIKPDLHYIKIGMEGEDSSCSAEEDIELSQATAHKYGLKLEVTDLQQEYWDQVVGYAVERVKKGLTPNPDVMCNRLIKFGAFEQRIGHTYDHIATGHYATNIEQDDLMWLGTAKDPVKDQTDFLAQIHPWQLKKALFPIGHYMKDEVRQVAEHEHLINARRKDSQGICFLGNIDYNEYVRRYLGEQPGDIIEQETGRIIGQHKGLWFHTIGQRKGLGLGGGPWFVIRKDVEQNILYVSHGYDPATAYKRDFAIHDFDFLTEGVTSVPDRITFKIRHTPEFHYATVETLSDGRMVVHSDDPIHGVAPGQFCVVYDQAHHRCYGSGEIAWAQETPKA